MAVNVKRAFNRAYFVLAAVWALYWLVVFPLQRQADATAQLNRDLSVCAEYGETDPACVGVKETWNARMDQWRITNFYSWAWKELLLVVFVFPVILYGCCRVVAAIAVWVGKGFKVPS